MRAFRFEALEERILLSAALDVVFIDSAIEDIDLLRLAAGDQAVIIVAGDELHGAADAIDQIVDELGRLDIKARSLTILSHGESGAIQLGGERVDATPSNEHVWAQLSGHLSDGANLYLYGCNVAQGQGQALLDAIAGATGADVFASDDVTGAGGDWSLEAASTGDEAELAAGVSGPLSHEVLAQYAAALAAPTAVGDEAITDEDTVISVGAANGVLSNDSNDPALDQTVPGYSLYYHAGSDVDGDSIWQSLIGGFDLTLHASVTHSDSPMTTYWGIDGSYVFTGAGGGTSNSLEIFPGNPTNDTVTFEMWFRPDALNNQNVLYETGATGDGVSLSTLNDEVHFKVKDSGSSALLSGAGLLDTEFNHLVGVIDVGGLGGANANTDVYLYLNGQLVDSIFDVAGLNDWAGGNAAGLGVVNSSINFPSGTAFVGEIASFRMYESALTADDVTQNYDAVRLPNYGLTIIDFDSVGARGTLTLGATGGYIYNPAGALDYLNVGETAIESFTYRVQDSVGVISTGILNISVVGVNDAPEAAGYDDVDLLEDDPELTLDLQAAFSDVDDAQFTYSLIDFAGDPVFDVVQLDALAGTLMLTPTANASGSVDVTIRATDSGGQSADQSFSVTVGSVNDAPVVSAPNNLVTETEIIFSAADGTLITLADIDAEHALVRLELVAEHGLISLADAGDVIFTMGDGKNDQEIRIVGTLDEINFAINNLRFRPDQESSSLLVVINDLGASGAGGELTASALINIHYEPVETDVRIPEVDDRRASAYFVTVGTAPEFGPIAEPAPAQMFNLRTPAAFVVPTMPDVEQPAGFGFPNRAAPAEADLGEHEGAAPVEAADANTEAALAGADGARRPEAEGEAPSEGDGAPADGAPVLSDATEEELHSSAIGDEIFTLPDQVDYEAEPLASRDVVSLALLPLLALQRMREDETLNRNRPAA